MKNGAKKHLHTHTQIQASKKKNQKSIFEVFLFPSNSVNSG